MGKREIETPQSPVSVRQRYSGYCSHHGRIDAEELAKPLDVFGVEPALRLREHARDGVARHHPGQEEVEGDRHPEGDGVELEAAQDETHVRSFASDGVDSVAGAGRARRRPRACYSTGSNFVRTSTVVGDRSDSVAYGSSSVGQPVKRTSVYAPHSGPGKSGTAGATSS